ncbi:unnamed protein product [Protopolystoma xenopodis]|uniref:Uncharacterized protein n=1 Tax=Protopolystoma xenopodis TaxID=117903 RepID=A0A3S5CHJ3_9PLAT|nr:unnamed protein product [Protopolystoma xenopodis]
MPTKRLGMYPSNGPLLEFTNTMSEDPGNDSASSGFLNGDSMPQHTFHVHHGVHQQLQHQNVGSISVRAGQPSSLTGLTTSGTLTSPPASHLPIASTGWASSAGASSASSGIIPSTSVSSGLPSLQPAFTSSSSSTAVSTPLQTTCNDTLAGEGALHASISPVSEQLRAARVQISRLEQELRAFRIQAASIAENSEARSPLETVSQTTRSKGAIGQCEDS